MPETLELERRVFDQHIDGWRVSNMGQFVLVKDDRVIGFYDTLLDAFNEGTRLFALFFPAVEGRRYSVLGHRLISSDPPVTNNTVSQP